MDGIVTKQALSKYEQDKDEPSARVLAALSEALGVKSERLLREHTLEVHFLGYRKRARMGKRAQEKIESLITQSLEERVRLQRLTKTNGEPGLRIQDIKVNAVDEAEGAADHLREQWSLGRDPLTSVTGTLEDHHVHVVEVDSSASGAEFDGLAAYVREDERVAAAAVVARKGAPGERQRFSLCHELGHLMLDARGDKLAEGAAHRFAGAFLAPAGTIRRDVGDRRTYVPLEELLLLKQRYGMSMQALLYRMHDLHIITPSYFKQWCVDISQRGWRTHEPQPLPAEQPVWLRQRALRAFAEGVISRDEAASLLEGDLESATLPALIDRRAFMQLPLDERRRVLAAQAEQVAEYYPVDDEWQGGDIVDDETYAEAR
jgi:Zn-dependent peptidase ImmA (M78 family)